MPNAAATSRPDVDAIKARVRLLAEIGDWSLLGDYADDNIPALIEYIEALEARQVKLETEVRGWRDCIVINTQMDGPKFMGVKRDSARRMWEKVSKALAAVGDGDG